MVDYNFLTIRDLEALYLDDYRIIINDGEIIDVIQEESNERGKSI